jgi:DHA1 family inner membrane transport protein
VSPPSTEPGTTDLQRVHSLVKAYEPVCKATKVRCVDASELKTRHLTLFALALGSFCIGTSEFASMGIIQLFSASLNLPVTTATNAITAYAVGVVIGAPLVTLAAARLNRRSLLLGLMGLFIIGNLLSAVASNLWWLMIARFISGMPQGAYFGAGAVVASYIVGAGNAGKAFAIVMTGLTIATIFGSPLATFLGQTLGWRETYAAVAGAAVFAFLALLLWVPRTNRLDGQPILQELSALRRRNVWGVLLVAALGISSIFAVYTFIGPMVTEEGGFSPSMIPIALGVFGVGMTTGNLIGGRLADADPARGIVLGFMIALVILALLGTLGGQPWVFFPSMFGVGAAMMMAVPTLQVRLTRFAPEAPSLMGAMNLASLNVANALGAMAAGLAVSSGWGNTSAAWAGFVLTALGLLIFLTTLRLGSPLPMPMEKRAPAP